jgi:hypothetical protein
MTAARRHRPAQPPTEAEPTEVAWTEPTQAAWAYLDEVVAQRQQLALALAPAVPACGDAVDHVLMLQERLEEDTRPLNAPRLPLLLENALKEFRRVQRQVQSILNELNPPKEEEDPPKEEDGEVADDEGAVS